MKQRTTIARWTKHVFLVALATIIALPAIAAADDTDENEDGTTTVLSSTHPPYYHPPGYRVVRRRRVVVVRPPPRPRRLVVVEPEQQSRTRTDLLGIGLRVVGAGLDGTKLGLEDFENPIMGGVGLQLRSRISDHWGLELSADYMVSDDGDTGFTQTSVPVMLSAMFFLFPDTPINPYALAGAGVHFTSLSYLDGLFEHHILEVAGQLGAGVQVKLGDHFAIHADIRFLTVYKNLGTTTEVSQSCLSSQAGSSGYCDGLHNLDPDDKFNIGVQFQAGATYYF